MNITFLPRLNHFKQEKGHKSPTGRVARFPGLPGELARWPEAGAQGGHVHLEPHTLSGVTGTAEAWFGS